MCAEKTGRLRFITFEGGEGTGKTTQATLLAERLRALGETVVVTREPGGSSRAEDLRRVVLSGQAREFGAFAETILFSAARIDHLRETIRPALARGEWVISDRFSDSTRAYQGALGNLDARVVRAMEKVVVGETRPGMTLVLDLPAEEGLARARMRAGGETLDRFEAEEMDFHRGLRRAFLDIATEEPDRIALVDATGSVEDIADRVWHAVSHCYALGKAKPRASSRRG